MEVWKNIEGFDGYEVSNLGNVKSMNYNHIKGKEQLLKCFKNRDGYITYCLVKNRKIHTLKLHRILAIAFIKNNENKPCVNHINGIKDDNRLENLEWSTYSENGKHAFDLGLLKPKYGELNNLSKITEKQVLEIRYINKKMTQTEIAKIYNITQANVQMILARKSWKHV